jgi:hypothetical protein
MITMIQQSVLDSQTSIQAELDRLTYSSYLLTLDPAKALSAVSAAIDGSLEKLTPHSDLQRRAVELSLRQLQSEVAWDREGSPYDLVFNTDLGLACSTRFTSFEEDMNGNPILLLDSGSRVAFVLHHVLGYNIEESALLAEMEEKGFRMQLRSAYVELASHKLRYDAHFTDVSGQCALV